MNPSPVETTDNTFVLAKHMRQLAVVACSQPRLVTSTRLAHTYSYSAAKLWIALWHCCLRATRNSGYTVRRGKDVMARIYPVLDLHCICNI